MKASTPQGDPPQPPAEKSISRPSCDPREHRHRRYGAPFRSAAPPPREPTPNSGVAILGITCSGRRPTRPAAAGTPLPPSTGAHAVFIRGPSRPARLLHRLAPPFPRKLLQVRRNNICPGAPSASYVITTIQYSHHHNGARIRWIMRGDIGGVQNLGIGAFGAARHRGKCIRLSTNDLMHLLPGETNRGECNNKNQHAAARRVECNNQPAGMVICIS